MESIRVFDVVLHFLPIRVSRAVVVCGLIWSMAAQGQSFNVDFGTEFGSPSAA